MERPDLDSGRESMSDELLDEVVCLLAMPMPAKAQYCRSTNTPNGS